MKKSLSLWQFSGFVFVAISGVLLHFLFDWTNQNAIVAAFAATNESIWEHMKLLFVPMFVFALIENRYIGKENKSFWCAKFVGILFGVVLIPVLYYTIQGAFGSTPDWVNIAIFFVVAATSFLLEIKLLERNIIACKFPKVAFLALWIMAFLFVLFSYAPPKLPLFEDLTRDIFKF